MSNYLHQSDDYSSFEDQPISLQIQSSDELIGSDKPLKKENFPRVCQLSAAFDPDYILAMSLARIIEILEETLLEMVEAAGSNGVSKVQRKGPYLFLVQL